MPPRCSRVSLLQRGRPRPILRKAGDYIPVSSQSSLRESAVRRPCRSRVPVDAGWRRPNAFSGNMHPSHALPRRVPLCVHFRTARSPKPAAPAMQLRNPPSTGAVTVEFLKSVIGADMAGVDDVLRESLRSDVALIHTIADYIIGGGGKRLRPALLLLAARASGYRGRDHRVLAAVIEMIHTATLLHDDVVDESDLRRGHATANAEFEIGRAHV